MESGCDPSVKNKKSQTPYVVSANKETRNIFRRFLAEFPDKYDYAKVCKIKNKNYFKIEL